MKRFKIFYDKVQWQADFCTKKKQKKIFLEHSFQVKDAKVSRGGRDREKVGFPGISRTDCP